MNLLIVSNKVKTYSLSFRTNIEILQELGHNIVWAADFTKFINNIDQIPCIKENISINTSPIKPTNYKAYKQLLYICDKYNIQGILCSTPIGGTLARIVAKKKNIHPVLYTAHGFLFFKGAPFINNTLFKWIELWLAHYTDALITITNEDYVSAQKFRLRNKSNPYIIHGAGIIVGNQVNLNKIQKKKELGLPEDSFVIISAGELNKNKNTEVMIKAIKELNDTSVHYLVCGDGNEKENLLSLTKKLGICNNVHLLGYRTDIAELMSISDVFVMMSFREGLPRAIMEAMDLGLPCVGSNTRGIRDLIDVGKGGFICNPKNYQEFSDAIRELKSYPSLCKIMGKYNNNKVKMYSIDIVRQELYNIYKQTFNK